MQSFISGLLILFQLVYMFIQCRYFDSCSFVANFEIFEKCESSIPFFFFKMVWVIQSPFPLHMNGGWCLWDTGSLFRAVLTWELPISLPKTFSELCWAETLLDGQPLPGPSFHRWLACIDVWKLSLPASATSCLSSKAFPLINPLRV